MPPAVLLLPFVIALALGAGPGRAETLVPPPAPLATEAPEARLMRVLQLDVLVPILREEGMQGGRDLTSDLPDGGGAGWEATLARIYDPAAMRAELAAELALALAASPLPDPEALGFFESGPGLAAIQAEAATRRAFLDPEAEAQAEADWAALGTTDPARAADYERYIAAGDTIELSVMGALNDTLAFLQGMNATLPGPMRLPDDEILRMTWAAEAEHRQLAVDWSRAYLVAAYAGFSDADLAACIAFTESPTGRALSRVTFQAFDRLLTRRSAAVGRAYGQVIAGQDI